MNLKKPCPCCKTQLTTRNVQKCGRTSDFGYDLLFLNCKACKSTTVLVGREVKRRAA